VVHVQRSTRPATPRVPEAQLPSNQSAWGQGSWNTRCFDESSQIFSQACQASHVVPRDSCYQGPFALQQGRCVGGSGQFVGRGPGVTQSRRGHHSLFLEAAALNLSALVPFLPKDRVVPNASYSSSVGRRVGIVEAAWDGGFRPFTSIAYITTHQLCIFAHRLHGFRLSHFVRYFESSNKRIIRMHEQAHYRTRPPLLIPHRATR
jgi:hypothetical protein